jgi:signal transduction histidine kinase
MNNGTQGARVVSLVPQRERAVFLGCGIVMMLVVGVGATLMSRSVAQEQAIEESERMTQRLSGQVIGPLVPGYLSKDPAAMADLRRAVRNRMTDSRLTEVTIWTGDGEVVYTDNPADIGKKFPPSVELLAAASGDTTAGVEDDPPEAHARSAAEAEASAADDTGPKRYVEVYTPLTVVNRPSMVLEAYYSYSQVNDLTNRLLRRILPAVLIPLLVLQLIQIPVGLSLGRRIRRYENEHSRLLQRELMLLDRERVRLATNLHDGPIQELAGTSYALGAVASTVAPPQAPLVGRIQDALLHSVQSLRGLMTDLDPPDLRSGQLDRTIHGLAEELRAEGVDVELDLQELPPLNEETMAGLYRVVREAFAHAMSHGAGKVTVLCTTAQSVPPHDVPRVRLVISDDGVGIDSGWLDRGIEGQFGLRLLRDRVTSLGGEVVITSTVGQGTTITAELPAQAEGPADEARPSDPPDQERFGA